MEKTTITRQQILAAIATEPLQAGFWIHGNTDYCPVCAVGAVLRSTMGIQHDSEIGTFMNRVADGNSISDTRFHDEDTHFLVRLSGFFEETVSEAVTIIEEEEEHEYEEELRERMAEELVPDIREQLKQFTMKYCPAEITI